ncbi:hypothetical protein evm_004533 [Chilo suppressalis]|nr:hypothetical protein evm_004533 [Chilo suppressalis]
MALLSSGSNTPLGINTNFLTSRMAKGVHSCGLGKDEIQNLLLSAYPLRAEENNTLLRAFPRTICLHKEAIFKQFLFYAASKRKQIGFLIICCQK